LPSRAGGAQFTCFTSTKVQNTDTSAARVRREAANPPAAAQGCGEGAGGGGSRSGGVGSWMTQLDAVEPVRPAAAARGEGGGGNAAAAAIKAPSLADQLMSMRCKAPATPATILATTATSATPAPSRPPRRRLCAAPATHTTIYVSSYCYVSSYYYILLCVLILLYMCPHTTIHVPLRCAYSQALRPPHPR
jgi:hypothetical protein